MSAKTEYIENMRREEATLSEAIGKMKTDLEAAKGDERVRLLETLEEARTHKEALAEKFAAAEAAGDDAWGELKAGLENTWRSLVSTVASVSAKVEEKVDAKVAEAEAADTAAKPSAAPRAEPAAATPPKSS